MKSRPLTALDINRIRGFPKRKKLSCGNNLYLVVERWNPATEISSKSFIAKLRYPRTKGNNKYEEIRLGAFGKGVGKVTLAEAREELEEIIKESFATGRNPKLIAKERKEGNYLRHQELGECPTLEEVSWEWLESKKKEYSESNYKDYRNKIKNQILPILGGDKPINSFKVENDGQQKVYEIYNKIQTKKGHQAQRVYRVVRLIFDFCIARKGAWFKGANPAASNTSLPKPLPSDPNKFLDWEDLPSFFKDLEINLCNGSLNVESAVKLCFLSAMRVGAIAGTKYEEFDWKEMIWTIPKERMKGTKVRKKEHHIPITPQIEALVKKMSRVNGDTGYVFYSPRGKNPYINESTINDHLKNLGYEGKQTAHGIRLSFNTHLVDQFNQYGNERIIDMCLAHTITGVSDVEFHYNKAKYWKQRVKLMKLWNKGIVKHGLKI